MLYLSISVSRCNQISIKSSDLIVNSKQAFSLTVSVYFCNNVLGEQVVSLKLIHKWLNHADALLHRRKANVNSYYNIYCIYVLYLHNILVELFLTWKHKIRARPTNILGNLKLTIKVILFNYDHNVVINGEIDSYVDKKNTNY